LAGAFALRCIYLQINALLLKEDGTYRITCEDFALDDMMELTFCRGNANIIPSLTVKTAESLIK
jgi:hypothetical protein